MLIKILVTLALNIMGQLACDIGCLVCRNSICMLCDTANFYYRIGTSCSSKVIENCLISSDGESCNRCKEGYYGNTQKGTCVKVPNDKKVGDLQNCVYFQDADNCMICNSNYYLNTLGSTVTCAKLNIKVPGCVSHIGDGKCGDCGLGILSSVSTDTATGKTQNSCVLSNDKNCQSMGVLQCVNCRSGYVLNKNSYLYNLKNAGADIMKKLNIDKLVTQTQFFSNCSPQNVPNCIVYASFDTCAVCSPGYYTTATGLCAFSPQEPIVNCLEYQKVGVCRLCVTGYYLETQSICSSHSIIIESCGRMSMNKKDICEECVTGFYLNTNKCVPRQHTISQCKTYSLNTDLCDVCESGFILNADKTSCSASIQFCSIYDLTTNPPICLSCLADLYLDPVLGCVKAPRSVEGCANYTYSTVNETSTNGFYYCSICKQNYYMDPAGKTCRANSGYMNNATSCAVLSVITSNTCISCNNDEVLFGAANYCGIIAPTSYDANCFSYNTTGSCEKCQSGYYAFNGTCSINPINYCNLVSAQTPTQCLGCSSSTMENFFINQIQADNKCIYSYKHVIDNCYQTNYTVQLTDNSRGVSMNVCTNCNTPYFPEMFDDAYFCAPRNKLLTDYNVASIINNCKIIDPLSLLCKACNFNTNTNEQYVLDNNVCVASCSSGKLIRTTDGDQFFTCATGTDRSCVRLAKTAANEYKCAQCLPGYYAPIETNNLSYNIYTTYAYLPAKLTGHYQAKSLSYSSPFNKIMLYTFCTNLNGYTGLNHDPSVTKSGNHYPVYIYAANYDPSSSIFTNCKYFSAFTVLGIQRYGCTICQFGFTGYFVKETTLASVFIPSCYLNTACNYGIYYNGLGSHLDHARLDFFTLCHQCVASGTIPTFSEGSGFANVTMGDLVIPPSSNTAYYFYPQNACTPPGVLVATDTNTYYPKACGVQEVITTRKLAPYPNPTSGTPSYLIVNPVCWACKPGYLPVVNTVTKYIISCTAIANCDPATGLTTFNKCVQCLPGYVLDALMEKCLPNSIGNCYVGTQKDGDTAAICNICTVGYIPSRNKDYCHQVNVANCRVYDLFMLNTVDPVAGNYLGRGCLECGLGYVATRFPQPQSLCVLSKQLQDRNYASIGVNNCEVYSGPKSCSLCATGFTLKSGSSDTCVLASTISNCEVYDQNKNCASCNLRYLLKNNACLDGSNYIANCLKFTDESNCLLCETGYMPRLLSSGTKCYLVTSAITNCRTYDTSQSLQGTLACSVCNTGYYAIALTNIRTCVKVPQVANCQTYNPVTYLCTACYPNYYLKAPVVATQLQKCIKRTNFVNGTYVACTNPDPNSDSCLICFDGYFVLNNTCQFKPTGVLNCDIYLDAITCSMCKAGYYLSANICNQISKDKLIPFCAHYSDENTCFNCATNYFLTSNTCKTITISNCNLLSSPSTCLTCAINYFLTDAGACTAGTVTNCQLHATISTCQRCATGYFLDANQACSKVPDANIIENCLYYETNSTCWMCANNTLLITNQTMCLDPTTLNNTSVERGEIDSNCDSYIYNYNCKVCKGNYLFQNGVCAPCNSNVANCQFCDSKNVTYCSVCMSGSYQDMSGLCHKFSSKNQATVADDGNVVNTGNGSPTTGFDMVMGSKVWIIFGLLALFHADFCLFGLL